MIKNKLIKSIVYGIFFMLVLSGNCFSDSLFKDYTEKSEQELTDETDAISKEIKDKFDQRSIESAQQKIDYYDYFSNLKKLIFYGTKLSTYAEYEQDLKFAKSNELFKGLPDNNGEKRYESAEEKIKFQTRFVKEKYEKMQLNIKDEIQTYEDLILMSLDACEMLADNDLSGFVTSEKPRQIIRAHLEISKDYKLYLQKRKKLATRWPTLESRIKQQIILWSARERSPDDPIIDPAITKAIRQ